MDLYDVMCSTFAARDFTREPVPDEVLFRILDQARFAPSGGNRQGWDLTRFDRWQGAPFERGA